MNLNPFKQRKALTGTPAVLDALNDRQWAPYPLLGGGSRQRIQDAYNTAKSANYAWIYQNSPAVRTVIDVVVRNMGQLDLRLFEEVDEAERQPKPDHPAALSLRYPNEETASDAFIRQLVKDFLIFDDACAVLTEAPGRQLTLVWVPFHMVEIRGSSLWRAEGYRVWRRDGTWVDFPPEQMLHWHGENPHDPRTGLSRLDTLREVIAEDAALQQATVELANAGLTEPTWIFRPLEAPQWSNEARKGFEEDVAGRMRSRNKKPVVLEEGMEMRSFGVNPKDAEMMAVRRSAIERVATVYGVPLGMVGLADGLEEAQKQFYADCLPPYCEEFTKMLNQRILVRVYNWTDGCFEFNLDEKHMGDDRLTALVSATGRPVMLTNEARARLNLPPVDQGDELVTPMNVIVGDNPKPSVDVMPPQDPNKPPQDGSYREQPPKALEQPQTSSTGIVKAEEYEPVAQLVPSRRADLTRQHRNIDLAKATVERHFNRLEKQLRSKANQTDRLGKMDWDRADREFADDIHRAVQQIVDKEGEIYAFKLAGHFDMGLVKNYLRAMSEGAAEGINDTIRQEIDALGLDTALGKRAQHVESAGAGLGANATRWAREEAARQSPNTDHRMKTWIANTNRHAEFDGDTVPIGDDWPAGFAPGSAPGCSCSMSIS